MQRLLFGCVLFVVYTESIFVGGVEKSGEPLSINDYQYIQSGDFQFDMQNSRNMDDSTCRDGSSYKLAHNGACWAFSAAWMYALIYPEDFVKNNKITISSVCSEIFQARIEWRANGWGFPVHDDNFMIGTNKADSHLTYRDIVTSLGGEHYKDIVCHQVGLYSIGSTYRDNDATARLVGNALLSEILEAVDGSTYTLKVTVPAAKTKKAVQSVWGQANPNKNAALKKKQTPKEDSNSQVAFSFGFNDAGSAYISGSNGAWHFVPGMYDRKGGFLCYNDGYPGRTEHIMKSNVYCNLRFGNNRYLMGYEVDHNYEVRKYHERPVERMMVCGKGTDMNSPNLWKVWKNPKFEKKVSGELSFTKQHTIITGSKKLKTESKVVLLQMNASIGSRMNQPEEEDIKSDLVNDGGGDVQLVCAEWKKDKAEELCDFTEEYFDGIIDFDGIISKGQLTKDIPEAKSAEWYAAGGNKNVPVGKEG